MPLYSQSTVSLLSFDRRSYKTSDPATATLKEAARTLGSSTW